MEPSIIDIPAPVATAFLAPLKAHLPHSFALVRRTQSSHLLPGTSPHAHFLFASAQKVSLSDDALSSPPKHFAAAYVDLSAQPETQVFLYSTLQDTEEPAAALPSDEVEHVLDLLAVLFHRIRVIAAAMDPTLLGAHCAAMVGNFHEATYRLLVARRGLLSSYWNPHDVWLFSVDSLPALPSEESVVGVEGLVWSAVRREDVPLIASRTTIPKIADTLMKEPNVAVRDGEGRLVAWGFMGVAGTLSTLHVEEPHRGKGIAKAIATKILREHSFGDDPWGSADVHVDNIQSQGVCKSLGGKKGMRTCWSRINFDSMP